MPSTKQSDFLSATYTGPQGPQGATGPQGPQGPSSMSDGTAAAPGLPFAANTATGFYRPAANTLGFVTAGVERMRIDSSGNVTGATISNPTLTLQSENVSPFIGFRNRIINGGFDIWQRGTSFSNVNDTYTADRFLVVPGGGTTGDSVSQQSFSPGQTDVPGEPTYFLRYTAGSTSSNKVMQHRIEDVRTGAGKTCTLSFYAKASIAHNSTVELQQNFGSGGSSSVTLSPVSYSMTTSWQKFTFNFSVPSISGKSIGTSSYVYIAFIRSLPASNLNIDIAQMQFEEGSVATSFDRRPFGTELALCQRYYEKGDFAVATARVSSSSTVPFAWTFKVPKRASASVSVTYLNGNRVGSGPVAFSNTLSSVYSGDGTSAITWESTGDSTNNGAYNTIWNGIASAEL